MGKYADEIDAGAEQLVTSDDLAEAVHSVCYWDLCTVAEMATFRLQLLASIVSEQDDGIAHALKENYKDILATWQDVHLKTLQAHNLQLRPGRLAMDDVAYIVTALAEGFALRLIAEPDAPVIDHERHRTLYGTACLALILGCMERVDHPQGTTIEQAVQNMIRSDKTDEKEG